MPSASSAVRTPIVELRRVEPKAEMSAETPLLLRVGEAAQLLGYGRSTVYEMVARGELRAIRHGRTTRIPRQALDEWIARQLAKAAGTDERTEQATGFVGAATPPGK